MEKAVIMKRALGILSAMLLASCAALGADEAQLAIDHNAETVKDVAVFVLMEAGYSVSNQGPTSIVFIKEMTGKRKFFTLSALSPPSCGVTPPRLYLTLDLSNTEHGTLATMSAMVEHTALVKHTAYLPQANWTIPYTVSSCKEVREPPPNFMHTGRLLTNLLEDIGSRTTALPRESVSHTVTTEP